MLSSQALETGIGLALMMFVFATAASGILDLGRRLLNSRSKDLEVALMSFLDENPSPMLTRIGKAIARIFGAVGAPKLEGPEALAWKTFKGTSVYRGAAAARNQVRPAYLSAKSFAEAVEEVLASNAPLTGPLKQRIDSLGATVKDDSMRLRAGLENWFDEAMSGLSARYQKKSTMWLFFIGLALAFSLNASFPHVARDLWQDSVTRATVVAAAEKFTPSAAGATQATAADSLEQIADATDQLTAIGIPIGWSFGADGPEHDPWWWSHILGWLLTAALASLGGPFWFDLLARLTAARSPKPPKAADDETSATRMLSNSLNAPPVQPTQPNPPPTVVKPVMDAKPKRRWWQPA